MNSDRTWPRAELRRVAYLLRRIYAIFRDPTADWRVAYLRIWGDELVCRMYGVSIITVGFVDERREIIAIDPRYDVLSTFVHECLHIIYEDAEEDLIKMLEKFIMDRISNRQAMHLHLLMAHHLI